jgi:hypothetical protein
MPRGDGGRNRDGQVKSHKLAERRITLYKYMPSAYVDAFRDGAIRFQPLTFYQRWEADRSIGDPHEAMLLFRPKTGLSIHNLTTNQRFTLPATFVSSIVANDVFVMCVSQRLDERLARDFSADACVEIQDTRRFVLKLQHAVRAQVEAGVLINGPVAYYDSEDPAGVNWALPDTILALGICASSRIPICIRQSASYENWQYHPAPSVR